MKDDLGVLDNVILLQVDVEVRVPSPAKEYTGIAQLDQAIVKLFQLPRSCYKWIFFRCS